jgi:hypothetical protein
MADTEYLDDASISDQDQLLRRIPPQHLVFDSNKGAYRPSSAAFDDSPDGSPMSVLIADVMLQEGRSPLAALKGHPDFSLVSIKAGLVRQCGQKIVRNPLPQEKAHGLVVGKKTNSVRKRLARNAIWIKLVTPSGRG